MRLLKDYKGVALIYIVLTLINVVWLVNYEKPYDTSSVSNKKNVVVNV